jgi:hypothetical protein
MRLSGLAAMTIVPGGALNRGIGIEAAASGAPCDMPVLLVLLDPVREFVLLRVIPGS